MVGNGKETHEKLKFPVSFNLKVVMESNDSPELIQGDIEKLLKTLNVEHVFKSVKTSNKGNFLSYTFQVTLLGQLQMSNMYDALKNLPGIKLAL
jgi:putative lipoic acid-binding regulatory protein